MGARTNKPRSSAKNAGNNVSGILHINANRNNTIVVFTNQRGGVHFISSGGRTEKGARKRTAYAAKQAGHEVGSKLKNSKMRVTFVKVIIKGVGSGRESAILGFQEAAGIPINIIQDKTPKAFGGVRKRKPKRI